ncbi:MAG: signal recognition particle receptor subunit alpha, partial [Gammaproteobacteria bacterium]|nr:signal recognition particle receptor subunit alpha [Gammaproteobacteria bacterium]
MFGFGKKKDSEKANGLTENTAADEQSSTKDSSPQSGSGFFGRLIAGLGKTRATLSAGLGNLILGSGSIDQDLLDEIETRLLTADVGMEATDQIINNLKQKLNRKQLSDPQSFLDGLKKELVDLLQPVDEPLQITRQSPFVILVVGVNGVGKTTTIGKLAQRWSDDGLSVLMAAGDTFRAAAVEQLEV